MKWFWLVGYIVNLILAGISLYREDVIWLIWFMGWAILFKMDFNFFEAKESDEND